ncbi:hypothetical protein K7J14_15210 [Treponema zuelzerae]|uniref:DUF4760 domain-containing protein n=1 Tax=Teretinema zuelzerae TaxID=156 RepID=A0AAE3EKD7_9SPIR|nr:hypothetical protein [Teretinema zuelzerae]MCD1656047.1 hypothetical protein [Teretinema zuelzerae]
MNDDQMSNIIALIAIAISVLSAIAVTYLSAWVTYRNDKRNRKREYINNLLQEFYGPLLSVLTENSTLYKEFGPPTIIGRSVEIAAANGDRWNSIKEDVIIPNLKFARSLLQKYWIQIDIGKKQYLKDLMLHCTAFSEYDKAPNEMYSKYKYDTNWYSKLANEIEEVKKESVL